MEPEHDEQPDQRIPASRLTPEQCVELQRRISAHAVDPSRGIAWEEVKAAALERAK